MKTIGKAINIIYRNIQTYINGELAAYGITISEVGIFMTLYREDGIRQEQIVKEVGVDKAAITKAVAGMEKKGMLYREADPKDKRAKLVYLTRKGRDIEPKITRVLEECNAIITKELNLSDSTVLYDFLDDLVNATYELKKGTHHEK